MELANGMVRLVEIGEHIPPPHIRQVSREGASTHEADACAQGRQPLPVPRGRTARTLQMFLVTLRVIPGRDRTGRAQDGDVVSSSGTVCDWCSDRRLSSVGFERGDRVTTAAILGIRRDAIAAWLAFGAAIERMAEQGRKPVCSQRPEQWFADRPIVRADAAEARLYCPALHPCAAFAQANRERHHVWGGSDLKPTTRKATARSARPCGWTAASPAATAARSPTRATCPTSSLPVAGAATSTTRRTTSDQHPRRGDGHSSRATAANAAATGGYGVVKWGWVRGMVVATE